MEKQLSFGLESFSAGKLRNKTLQKKRLSGKRPKKPRQLVNELLPSKKKESNLQSLSLDKLVPKEQPLIRKRVLSQPNI